MRLAFNNFFWAAAGQVKYEEIDVGSHFGDLFISTPKGERTATSGAAGETSGGNKAADPRGLSPLPPGGGKRFPRLLPYLFQTYRAMVPKLTWSKLRATNDIQYPSF